MVTAEETCPEERFKKEILLHLNCIRGKKKNPPRSIADNSSGKTEFRKNFAPDVACHKTETPACCCPRPESCSGLCWAIGISEIRTVQERGSWGAPHPSQGCSPRHNGTSAARQGLSSFAFHRRCSFNPTNRVKQLQLAHSGEQTRLRWAGHFFCRCYKSALNLACKLLVISALP